MSGLQKRSKQTAEKLLSTAEQMLNQDPFSELTIPALVTTAGVSVGGFYGRFASRDDLFRELYLRYRKRRDELIRQMLSIEKIDTLTQKERVEKVVRLLVTLHSNDVGVLRHFILSNWLAINAPVDKDVEKEMAHHIKELGQFLINDSSIAPESMHRIMKYLISLSKDHIVIQPSSVQALDKLDLTQLVKDITVMIQALLIKEGK